MNREFSDRAREFYPQLSKSQRLVVDRLQEEPQLLAFSTAAEIGMAAGVSEATVIRLAHALGYKGFVEMQEDAQKALRTERTRQVLTRAASGLPDQAGTLERVLLQDVELLRHTVQQNSAESFERAVEVLVKARHIFVAGARTSYAVAVFLGYTLRMHLGTATILEVDHPHFLRDLAGLQPDAALVAIAFPRYTESTLRIADYATRQRCPVVAITDGPLSPLGRKADVVLTAAIESPPAATDSYVAPLAVATALVTGVALRRQEDVDRQLSRVEAVIAQWGTTKW